MAKSDDLLMPRYIQVAIVGAGPAGLGIARVLHDLSIPDVWVIERGLVGQSFLNWPAETHLLTPSFPGNVFGVTDLNAISYDSSPGWSLKCEHPDGKSYASYLSQAARAFRLNVQTNMRVLSVEPEEEGFTLQTNHGEIRADFVIWACGQFGMPSNGGIIGSQHARHYAAVHSWQALSGNEHFVIGGYESGIDAALALISEGKKVTVFDPESPWDDNDKDPSRTLSPYTKQRLAEARKDNDKAVNFTGNTEIVAIDKRADGFHLLAGDGRSWISTEAPILATGFDSGTDVVSEWLDYNEEGLPLLTPQDESTQLPGLFLVGPEVSHHGQLFCFIYKFRQRFAVVARAIAGRLGIDYSDLELYAANNMYLEDLTCCEDDKCMC
nr:NAD(P)/FAD-dependent oxidoreductase [uncultured Cohaesibacter sp.]